MSRLYSMGITIKEFDTKGLEDILQIIEKEWNIQHKFSDSSALFAYGEDYLCGGEEEFVDRLAIAVWKANNNYCHVEVEATNLEDLPYETHIRNGRSDLFRNREDYEKEKVIK